MTFQSDDQTAQRLLSQAPSAWEPFWEKADKIRESVAGHTFTDSADLIREDRDC
jgi:hypothetical protein